MVAPTRISTYANQNKLMNNLNLVQTKLSTLQMQSSSGMKSETFGGLPGRAEFVTALENKMRSADQYVESNTVIRSRLKTMDVAVSNVIGIINDLRKLIGTARSAYITEKDVLTEQANSMLKNLSNQLNSNVGGRYLFAGTKTDAPPVVENIPDNLNEGVPDDGYYMGDNEVLSGRINDKFNIGYGVTANDPGFQTLVASINLTISGIEDQDFAKLEEAMELSSTALEGVNAVQNRINNNVVNIDNANEEHSSLKLYWKGVAETEVGADLVEISTGVAINQAILQASYQAFARITSLKLSDFL